MLAQNYFNNNFDKFLIYLKRNKMNYGVHFQKNKIKKKKKLIKKVKKKKENKKKKYLFFFINFFFII